MFGSLCAAVDNPAVRPAMLEVSEARAQRLVELLVGAGRTPEDAARRARLIDAAYVGFWRLVDAGTMPVDERNSFRIDLIEAIHPAEVAAP